MAFVPENRSNNRLAQFFVFFFFLLKNLSRTSFLSLLSLTVFAFLWKLHPCLWFSYETFLWMRFYYLFNLLYLNSFLFLLKKHFNKNLALLKCYLCPNCLLLLFLFLATERRRIWIRLGVPFSFFYFFLSPLYNYILWPRRSFYLQIKITVSKNSQEKKIRSCQSRAFFGALIIIDAFENLRNSISFFFFLFPAKENKAGLISKKNTFFF